MKLMWTPARMREAEQEAVRAGIPAIELMERAAAHVAQAAQAFAPAGRIIVLCGVGNNGGDGLAAARLLKCAGRDVGVALLGDAGRMSPDARTNLARWQAMGLGLAQDYEGERPALVVDALFGTGLARAPQGELARAIRWSNQGEAPVLAVDMPSGVDAADGSVHGEAVVATWTLTFQTMKLGHALFPGRAHSGRVLVRDIGLRMQTSPQDCTSLERADIGLLLPARAQDAHKGLFGRALLVAGSYGMAGAAALCARGALHAGAGLVSVATVAQAVPIVQTLAPEATALCLPSEDGAIAPSAAELLAQQLIGKQAAAIGPGMTAGAGTVRAVQVCLAAGLPLVVDADALNALALHPQPLHAKVVLTPHMGEMARLMGEPVGHPVHAARAYAQRSGAVVLLKGASTVIAAPDGRTAINLSGTPAMARGGSGDVLTGIIAALLAQGLAPFDAARLGAYVHGLAGEAAFRRHGISMTAMDLPRALDAAFCAEIDV